MDETFEEVDFGYTMKSSNEKVTVETLEILEHGTISVKPESNADEVSGSS